MTPLDKTLKRAILLKGEDYVVTLSPESLKLSRKGHRLGVELKWTDLISGDTALAVALQASLGSLDARNPPSGNSPRKPAPRAPTRPTASTSAGRTSTRPRTTKRRT